MHHVFFSAISQLFFMIVRILSVVPGNSGRLILFGSLYCCTGLKYCQSVRTAKMNVGLKVKKTTRLLINSHVLCNTENNVSYSQLIPTLLRTVSGVRRRRTLYTQFFFFLTAFLHRQYCFQEIPSNVYACELLLSIFMAVELRLYTYSLVTDRQIHYLQS